MTTIPEEARKLIDEGNCADCINDMYCDCYERFSQALLAEYERGREEAAKIAEHFAQQWDTGGPDGQGSPAFYACMQVAEAIRSTN